MGVLLDLKGKKMYTSSYQYEMDYNHEGYAFNLISYENLFEKDVNTLNWKEVQQEHRTPYIIWTNYTLDSENEDMSSNYFGSYILEQAGLELTEYNRALLSMKEKIPIIGTGAICDSMGKWYKMDELPKEYEELVNCYKIVQYNNVFDRKNRVDSVFDLN